MKISDIMTRQVISLRGEETAVTAARLLTGHNIGAVPVVDKAGCVVGMVTDRDLMARCMASGRDPAETPVSSIMTSGAVTALSGEEAEQVCLRMGREQIRRMPVVEGGRLAGIVSLSDLARHDPAAAAAALEQVSGNISRR